MSIINFFRKFGLDIFVLLIRSFRKKIIVISIVVFTIIYCLLSFVNLPISSGKNNDLYDSITDSQTNLNFRRQHKLKDIFNNNDTNEHQSQQLSNDSLMSPLNSGYGGSDNYSGIKCRNSVQGKLFIVDDRGFLCERKAAGINGCCNESSLTTVKYTCDTCLKNGCCAIYEYCISCCMSPINRDILRSSTKIKSPVMNIFLASITDHFELCLTKCRTSSESVLHENTYRNVNAKHCYVTQ